MTCAESRISRFSGIGGLEWSLPSQAVPKIAEEEAEEDGEPLWPIDAPGEDDDIEDDIDENDEDDGVIDLL